MLSAPSKRYCIKRRARTLLGLQLHYVYAVSLILCADCSVL